MLTPKQTFFIKYTYLGEEKHCQIEAHSHKDAEQLFYHNFKIGCTLIKIQTTEEISHDISENLMSFIKQQFENI